MLRELRGWSQRETAVHTGLSHSMINRLESGLRPSREALAKLARGLGVKPSALLAPRPKLPPLPNETTAA